MQSPRRSIRRSVALACAAALCSSCGDQSNAVVAGTCVTPSYGAPRPASDALAAQRQACQFSAGAPTSQTVGGPLQDLSALEHVVILVLENRSFDHYFSDLPSIGISQVDVAGADTNPDGNGGVVARYHETSYCEAVGAEPQHEWSDAHVALAGGRMDGFVAATGAGSPMGYYDCHDLPFYYALAKNFAISDRHFSPLLGPTWPNRMFLFSGTSCDFAEGSDTNALVSLQCGATHKSLLELLGDAGVSYRVYDESGFASVVVGLLVYPSLPASIADFEADAMLTKLPAVSIVGASTGGPLTPPEDDDHPVSDVQRGQAFVQRIYRALTTNADVWKSTALFITYDENGGYYDHVTPPAACDPAGPANAASKRDYLFTQYGFRVPLIAVSPFARAGHVSHVDTDHTSIARFVEHWKNLGALTARDANAWPLLDLFDFNQPTPALPTLPVVPPNPTTCAVSPAPVCP